MISRRILAAVALLCMIAPAHAQKTKAALTSEINTNWPDNSSGAITPAILRSTVIDIVNSYVDWLTCTGSGGVVYWTGGIPTCLPAGTDGQQLTLSGGVPVWSNLASNLIAGAGLTITGTISPTIAITNSVSPTTVGAANAIPQIVYNAQGEITSTSVLSPTVALTGITNVSAKSIAGNNTGTTANAINLTPGQVGGILCTPIRTVLTSGTAATFTTPSCNSVSATWLEVEVQGGGAGGTGSGTAVNGGAPGNASSFGALTASGGGSGSSVSGGAGGACSGSLGTQQNFPGSAGTSSAALSGTPFAAGNGGVSYYGGYGAGSPGNVGAAAGGTAPANSGGGGGGGGITTTASVFPGGGGGAGCHINTVIVSPVAATFTYTVGAVAAGGVAGTSGNAGGGGADGRIAILAHWQ